MTKAHKVKVLVWSAPVPFEQASIRSRFPLRPGVYQLIQQPGYARYEGATSVVKIGKSDGHLQSELLNHFRRHTVANRLARIRKRPGVVVSVVFAEIDSANVTEVESQLLREFEDAHWELPVLNSQRGYARDQDGHFRA